MNNLRDFPTAPHPAELSTRIKKLQNGMAARNIAGALILQNTDLYYFTGRIWPAYLYVPVAGDPVFLNRHRGEVAADCPWPVVKLGKPDDLPGILQDFGLSTSGSLGLEMDVLPVTVWQRLQKTLPRRDLVDVGRLIRQLRAVKTPWEIGIMRGYAKKDLDLWRRVPEIIHNVGTDLELTAAFDAQARLQGQQGIIRLRGFNQEMACSCIMAGEQAATISSYDVPLSSAGLSSAFPFGASGTALEPGKPILIDFGSCYASYILDHTRMFAINHLPDQAWRAFDTALAIQQEMIAMVKPGVSCGAPFERAREMAEKAGLIEGFMGAGGGVPFIGHGVGLEVDELPVLARGSREILEEGMVIAIEPKFALPGIGAIGIENCFAVTNKGLETLTVTPDDLQIINR